MRVAVGVNVGVNVLVGVKVIVAVGVSDAKKLTTAGMLFRANKKTPPTTARIKPDARTLSCSGLFWVFGFLD